MPARTAATAGQRAPLRWRGELVDVCLVFVLEDPEDPYLLDEAGPTAIEIDWIRLVGNSRAAVERLGVPSGQEAVESGAWLAAARLYPSV